MSLDYEGLPREYPRKYLPEGIDPANWNQVEVYFTRLQRRRIGSLAGLLSWLSGYSELFTVMSEAAAIRYVRMTEQTDKKEYLDAYMYFLENVEPKLKMAQYKLNRKFERSGQRKLLSPGRYGLLQKRIGNSLKLFNRANIELEKEERKLAQRQQSITGSMTVNFDGGERTMPEMSKYLEQQDRAIREKSWRLAQGRFLKDREALDGIFDGMVSLRDRIARNAGFRNFRDYSFVSRERFDYGPEDCLLFHDAVEKEIVPLVREVHRMRQKEMDLDSIRPWDLVVDPSGKPPLRPFKSVSELIRGCERIFEKVDPVFSTEFRKMAQLNLLDLVSRPGKALGGYNTELLELRLPFIFMNSVGRDQDLWTLMHESGHAFHVFEMRDKSLHYLYRSDNTPTEFAEVASMTMELLGGENLAGAVYGEAEAARSRHDHFLSITSLLPWICTIDAFQHWIYLNPGHTREERNEAWVKTYDRFSPGANWEGLEEQKRSLWHRQMHLFQSPFYYIEYGIAQLGALGVWSRYLTRPKEAVEAYRGALALGGSKPLPQLFKEAGLPWDFSARVVKTYGKELREVLTP